MTAQEDLFLEWERREHHHGAEFIRDGIIDDDRWAVAKPRILFLLKEAYAWEDERPLNIARAIARDGKPTKLPQRNSALLAYALNSVWNEGGIPPIPDEGADAPRVIDSFLSCAWVNVKKSHGQKSSDGEDIRAYAEKDGDFIRRQIEIIAPDVIVTGNTWHAVSDCVFDDTAERVTDMVLRWGDRWIVDYWHPGNHFPTQLNYYGFAGAMQSALHSHDDWPAGP